MNYISPGKNRGEPLMNSTGLERLFNNGTVGSLGASETTGTDPDETLYQALIREMIDDAQSFEDSVLAPARDDNLHYFYGETPEPEGEGKSTAVSTDFRDTVMAILPSLIRIFTSSEPGGNVQAMHGLFELPTLGG
jgi:hypothetical protein